MPPSVRPISQVLLHVSNGSEANLFSDIRTVILEWIEQRAGDKLPDNARQGDSFILDGITAQRTEAVALPDRQLWAARLDNADTDVAQRIWTTEVIVHEEEDGTVHLGCRVQCVMHGDNAPFERSIPKLVRDIVEVKGNTVKLDDRPISVEPWFIYSTEQVGELEQLLRHPRRRGDVIIFSLPEDSSDWNETVAEAPKVAQRTVGAAHVAVITGPASRNLTDRIGKEFSVYHQAIRTYRPGFNPDTDEPRSHPRRLAEQIAEWGDEGPKAYERLLISQALLRTVSGQDIAIEQELPPFPKLRRISAEQQRKRERQEASSVDDILKLADQEIKELKDERDKTENDYKGLLTAAEDERDSAQEDLVKAKGTIRHLRGRIKDLEQQLEQSAPSKPLIPDSLDGFEEWCEKNLSGAVELLNRASRGVKKSQYEDVPLIYKALLLLRDYYAPMRCGEGDRDAFNEKCSKLGIEEEKAISDTRAGEEGDDYKVHYRGRKRLLERHLKKGEVRDERHCFRLYFFWDDEEEQVVVGWLPSHLNTRAT